MERNHLGEQEVGDPNQRAGGVVVAQPTGEPSGIRSVHHHRQIKPVLFVPKRVKRQRVLKDPPAGGKQVAWEGVEHERSKARPAQLGSERRQHSGVFEKLDGIGASGVGRDVDGHHGKADREGSRSRLGHLGRGVAVGAVKHHRHRPFPGHRRRSVELEHNLQNALAHVGVVDEWVVSEVPRRVIERNEHRVVTTEGVDRRPDVWGHRNQVRIQQLPRKVGLEPGCVVGLGVKQEQDVNLEKSDGAERACGVGERD